MDIKCLYLYWITLWAKSAVLPRDPARATLDGSSDTTGENRSIRRKSAVFGRDKLNNTLLTCHRRNFNQITELSRNRTLVAMVKETCTTTVQPASRFAFVKHGQIKTLACALFFACFFFFVWFFLFHQWHVAHSLQVNVFVLYGRIKTLPCALILLLFLFHLLYTAIPLSPLPHSFPAALLIDG